MRILLAGGGTGGHLYPLIAIAEELHELADQEKIINLSLFYMADKPLDPETLEKHFITFIRIPAGKLRVYPSFATMVDFVKTLVGIFTAIWKVFRLYPDVVVSKGGYASFPTLVAARLLGIPVIIHESDTIPGRVNRWAGRFATRIALSFPEAAAYFPKKKVAVVGQPVRREIRVPAKEGGALFFNLSTEMPTVGVIGGSQGAQPINEAILELLPELLHRYQVIHQTGKKHFEEITTRARVLLERHPFQARYRPFATLSGVELKMFAGAARVVVARAGSSLFEFAAWGTPSILIPYPLAHGNHQKQNAYHYARAGGCAVIEEANLSDSVLLEEIDRLMTHQEIYQVMSKKALQFFKPDAGRLIASEAISIALEHER